MSKPSSGYLLLLGWAERTCSAALLLAEPIPAVASGWPPCHVEAPLQQYLVSVSVSVSVNKADTPKDKLPPPPPPPPQGTTRQPKG